MRNVVTTMTAVLLIAGSAHAGGEHCPAPAQECLNYMAASLQERGWLGVELNVRADGTMTIEEVAEASPAREAGLVAGDVIVGVDGVTLGIDDASRAALQEAMTPGRTLTYQVVRGKDRHAVKVTLRAIPDTLRHQIIGAHMLEHAKPLKS